MYKPNLLCLVNDNLPIRLVNKPFEVVRNGQRLLTRHDLWYHDPDVHQDDLAIRFIRRGMTNGDILRTDNKKEVSDNFFVRPKNPVFIYSCYYAEACDEWRGSFQLLNAWATQL